MLARELRDAATVAGRPDVAAKAEESIALLMGGGESTGVTEGRPDTDKTNTVIRILDGLGF